jgi:hypothetical protein
MNTSLRVAIANANAKADSVSDITTAVVPEHDSQVC